jgi:hypothetical protein
MEIEHDVAAEADEFTMARIYATRPRAAYNNVKQAFAALYPDLPVDSWTKDKVRYNTANALFKAYTLQFRLALKEWEETYPDLASKYRIYRDRESWRLTKLHAKRNVPVTLESQMEALHM